MDPYRNLSWFWFYPFENIIGRPISVALQIIRPQQKHGRIRMMRLFQAIWERRKPRNRPMFMKIDKRSLSYLDTADHPLIYPEYNHRSTICKVNNNRKHTKNNQLILHNPSIILLPNIKRSNNILQSNRNRQKILQNLRLDPILHVPHPNTIPGTGTGLRLRLGGGGGDWGCGLGFSAGQGLVVGLGFGEEEQAVGYDAGCD